MKDLSELRSEIESILFAAGRKVELEDLKRMCSEKGHRIKEAITSLKMDYDMKNSSLAIMEDNEGYKLTVREKYLPLVENIVTETELPKSVMETLAVIAFKYPILQSDLVKIRSNKCYDHLSQLDEAGFIRREKHGRTNTITLTQKFFDYFELPPGKVREAFASFEGVAKAIEEKEKHVESMKEQAKVKKDEEKKEPAARLEVFDDEVRSEPQEVPKIQVYDLNTDKLGDLQVVDESGQMPEEDLPDEKEASDAVDFSQPDESAKADSAEPREEEAQESPSEGDAAEESHDENPDENPDKAMLDDYNVSDDSTSPLWQADEVSREDDEPEDQKAEDEGEQPDSQENEGSDIPDEDDEPENTDKSENLGKADEDDEAAQEGEKDYFGDEFSEEDMTNKSADEKVEYNLKKKVYERANALLNPEQDAESEDNREKELDSISEELQESKDKLED